MRKLLLALAITFTAAAQQNPGFDDPKILLLATRKRVMLTVERLPKYLCTETVDRSSFQPQTALPARSCDALAGRKRSGEWKLKEHTSDRLRLDVAVGGDTELFSWVGEDRFRDQTLAGIVKGGATSTGMFASFLSSVFGTNDANFTYDGNVNSNSRALAEFGFQVALEKSRYRIGNHQYSSFVPYEGTFLVDTGTAELVSLTVHADSIPQELNTCESTTSLTYTRMRVHDFDFLIPQDAHWRVVGSDGSELEYQTAFSACHEFLGKSTLSFEDAASPAPGGNEPSKIASLDLPAGLSFSLKLSQKINTATAAAGDAFRATLANAIRGNRHETLLPKGAEVRGRITRIERIYDGRSQSLLVGFKVESVEIDGQLKRFDASLGSITKRRQKTLDALVAREDLGTFDRMLDTTDPAAGFLEFEDVTGDFVIDAGVGLVGKTSIAK